MTFNNLTRADAERIRDVLAQLEASDASQAEAVRLAERVVVKTWWDSIKPSVPNTREEALAVFKFIELEIVGQTANRDSETVPVQKRIFEVRVGFLNEKLIEANEKYKERKRNG